MRMKTIATLSVLLLGACSTSHPNMRYFRTTSANPKALVVIDQDDTTALGYVDANNRLHIILTPLDVLAKVSQLWFSPDQKRVIIESYGEGHQFISVYDIGVLVRDDDEQGGPMIPPAASLDPYPSAFENIRWVDGDCIEFSANADFKKFDKTTRRGSYADNESAVVARVWRWRLADDTFEEVRSRQD